MSIIVNKNTKVLVQGITGKEGRFQSLSMMRYGTTIVAGVTPGKGGQDVEGIPVFNTVQEAVLKKKANTSIIFVPPSSTKQAVLEATDAGIKTIVVITEGVPQIDEMVFIAKANEKGVTMVGPNCPGIINPSNRIKVGILPCHIFEPGIIGIVTRSGTLTSEITWHLTNAGLGQSTCVGIGGDPIIGLDFISVLEMFKYDNETKGVVLIGEIGGNAEEIAADYIKRTKYPKPVVAYIVGRTSPPEKRMGHAGAIIVGNNGAAKSKIDSFIAAMIPVAEKPSGIAKLIKNLIVDCKLT